MKLVDTLETVKTFLYMELVLNRKMFTMYLIVSFALTVIKLKKYWHPLKLKFWMSKVLQTEGLISVSMITLSINGFNQCSQTSANFYFFFIFIFFFYFFYYFILFYFIFYLFIYFLTTGFTFFVLGKMDDVLDSVRAIHLRRNIYRYIPKLLVSFLLWN